MTFNEIVDKLATENAASKIKHGMWADLPIDKQFDAIYGEFGEWLDAYLFEEVAGDHGEIAELIDLANVCFRRIMFLSGDRDA